MERKPIARLEREVRYQHNRIRPTYFIRLYPVLLAEDDSGFSSSEFDRMEWWVFNQMGGLPLGGCTYGGIITRRTRPPVIKGRSAFFYTDGGVTVGIYERVYTPGSYHYSQGKVSRETRDDANLNQVEVAHWELLLVSDSTDKVDSFLKWVVTGPTDLTFVIKAYDAANEDSVEWSVWSRW